MFLVSGDIEGAIEMIAAKLGSPAKTSDHTAAPLGMQSYIKTRIRSGGDGSEVVLLCDDGT